MQINIDEKKPTISIYGVTPPDPPWPSDKNKAYVWFNENTEFGYMYVESQGAWVAPGDDNQIFDIVYVNESPEDAYDRAMSII